MEFFTETYRDQLRITIGLEWSDDESAYVDADGNVVADPETIYRVRTTSWYKGDTIDTVVYHRVGLPAVVDEFLDPNDSTVIMETRYVFYQEGEEYRDDGPTDIQGDEFTLDAEYNYGGYPQDVALQIAFKLGEISQQEYDDAIAAYNALPKYAERGEYGGAFFSTTKSLPFADKCKQIVDLLDGVSGGVQP